MAFFLILLILCVVHFDQNVYNNKYKELTVKVGEKWHRLIKGKLKVRAIWFLTIVDFT